MTNKKITIDYKADQAPSIKKGKIGSRYIITAYSDDDRHKIRAVFYATNAKQAETRAINWIHHLPYTITIISKLIADDQN